MTTFFMFGKYSPEALKHISSNRTDEAVKIINRYEGTIRSMYVLQGIHDLVFIVEFPAIEHVLKASVALNKSTGISFVTSPAITVEEFDKWMSGI